MHGFLGWRLRPSGPSSPPSGMDRGCDAGACRGKNGTGWSRIQVQSQPPRISRHHTTHHPWPCLSGPASAGLPRARRPENSCPLLCMYLECATLCRSDCRVNLCTHSRLNTSSTILYYYLKTGYCAAWPLRKVPRVSAKAAATYLRGLHDLRGSAWAMAVVKLRRDTKGCDGVATLLRITANGPQLTTA